jgi:hypothetical protein
MGAEQPRGDRAPHGAVYIAPGRVYELVLESRESLLRIEGKVDSIDRSVTDSLAGLEDDIEAIGKRVTPLEQRVWAFPSLTGLLGLVALVLTIMQMNGAA